VQDRVETELRAAIERHVAEAVKAEREECAKVCDREQRQFNHLDVNGRSRFVEYASVAGTCAAAIRARADNEGVSDAIS